jgi:hypothetical protein
MKNDDNSNVEISKSPLHRLIILKAMLKALRFSVRRSDVDLTCWGNFHPFDVLFPPYATDCMTSD